VLPRLTWVTLQVNSAVRLRAAYDAYEVIKLTIKIWAYGGSSLYEVNCDDIFCSELFGFVLCLFCRIFFSDRKQQ